MAESENIVAETAERIFADLADAQTINRDSKGSWKAPLWQALTEAGLPLSWVPEDCDGSGASLAEGFQRFKCRGAFCGCRAARRDDVGGMAAVASKNRLAGRRNDGGAGKPERPRRAECRRDVVRPRARRAVRQGGRAFRRACTRRRRFLDRAGRRQGLPDRGRPQSRHRRQRHRDASTPYSLPPSSRRQTGSTRRR